MKKRYQVFISSTFSDLREERNKVTQAILRLGCFPAGMELFPAMDEEQYFKDIKRIIDDCDYYILLIGGRYGSTDDNGVSNTEKEFDYAVSIDIPILAFLHNDTSSLPFNKTDDCDELRQKLVKFRNKVLSGRLVQFWGNADELELKVFGSLNRSIKMFPRRGGGKADSMVTSLDIADWNEEYCAHFKGKRFDFLSNSYFDCDLKSSYTWFEWFKIIAIELDDYTNRNKTAYSVILDAISYREQMKLLDINYDDFVAIEYHFINHGLITKERINSIDRYKEKWLLTKKGEIILGNLYQRHNLTNDGWPSNKRWSPPR